MIRAVFDANVLVSAALARDPQAQSVRLFDAATTSGRIRAICRDPADDYLLALALESTVDVVVSGDRDLLELQLTDITIVTPRELVERLERETS